MLLSVSDGRPPADLVDGAARLFRPVQPAPPWSQARFGATLLLAAGFLLGGCHTSRPDIVLVTIEGVRASDLERPGSIPALQTLAEQGWRPSCAITPSPEACAAAGSLLTGLPPARHGLTDDVLGRLDPAIPLVTEELKAAGYSTAAFLGGRSVNWKGGLARGFQLFDEAPGRNELMITGEGTMRGRGWDGSGRRRNPQLVAQQAGAWFRREKAPRFLWIHLVLNPGDPRRKPDEMLSRALGEMNVVLAELLSGLDLGGGRKRLTIVAGTSGYGRGEHGEWTSGLNLYDTTIRVPLIAAGPGAPARTPQGPISTACVAGLIRAAAGLARFDPPSGGEAVSATWAPEAEFGWPPKALLRTGERAYADADPPELYDLSTDPDQLRNLQPGDEARGSEMASRLTASHPYGDRVQNGTDPIAASARARVLSLLLQSGQSEQGEAAVEAALREALALSPSNFVVVRRLAVLLKTRGETERALRALDPLREAAKSRPDAAMSLATALQEIGEYEEAVSVLRKATSEPKASVRLRIALAEALEAGKAPEEAADELKAVADAEPRDPRLQERLGDTYLTVGHGYRAKEYYDKALAAGDRDTMLLMKIGHCLMTLKDGEGALAIFKEAAQREPDMAAPHIGQGDALAALGRLDEALKEYRKSMPKTVAGFEEGMKIADRLAQKGQDQLAFAMYQELAKDAPKRFEPHYRVGEILLQHSKLDEAKLALDYALGLEDRPVIHYQLARIALAKKNEASALAEVRRMVEKPDPAWLSQVSKDPIFSKLPKGSEIRNVLDAALREAQKNVAPLGAGGQARPPAADPSARPAGAGRAAAGR